MRRHTKLKKKLAFSKNMHMHLRVNLEEDLVATPGPMEDHLLAHL